MANTILVVDDEPDLELLITQRFRKQIRDRTLQFVFASNGQEALKLLDTKADMDVVLTDINMPVMDGLTLLTNLNERYPLLKAVIVSAYGDMANIRTALNRGAPTLGVTTRNLGDAVEVRIRDNGNGIPAEILDRVFNPFFTTKPIDFSVLKQRIGLPS